MPATSSYTQHSKLLVKSTFVPELKRPCRPFWRGLVPVPWSDWSLEWSPPSPLFPPSEWISLMKDLIARGITIWADWKAEQWAGRGRKLKDVRETGSHHKGQPKPGLLLTLKKIEHVMEYYISQRGILPCLTCGLFFCDLWPCHLQIRHQPSLDCYD